MRVAPSLTRQVLVVLRFSSIRRPQRDLLLLEVEFNFVQIFDVYYICLPDLRLLQVYNILLLGKA